MRPINLKLKGINSYVSEQTVDFEKLSQFNLFGIFGETGSGKTSILDAIVMALYGTSERDVTQNIINVHCSDAYIIFEFEMLENGRKVRYIVRRDYKLRPSGLKTDAVLLKSDTKEVLAEHTDEVNERILKIIRVGKKEFLKCIALPQGEFDRFLLDTPMARKKTVAKLFNLEAFGQDLNDKVKNRKDLATVKKLNLEDKLNLYKEATPENLEKLRADEKAKVKQIADLEFGYNKLTIDHTLILSDFERKEQLKDLQMQLDLRLQDKKDMDYLQKQISYTKVYGDYLMIKNKLHSTQIEEERLIKIVSDLKEKLAEFEKKYNEENETLSTLTWSKKQYEQMLLSTKNNAELKKRIEAEIKGKEDEYNSLKAQNQELLDKINSEESKLQSLKDEISTKTTEYNKLAKEINGINDALNQIEGSKTNSIKQEIISFLKDLRRPITQEVVNEIMGTKACSALKEMYDKIRKREKDYQEEIRVSEENLNILLRFEESLEDCERKFSSQLKEATKNINNIQADLENARQESFQIQNSITGDLTAKETLEASIYRLELIIATDKKQLIGLPSLEAVTEIEEKLKETNDQISSVSSDLGETNKNKQQTIIDLEINTSLLETTKSKIKELNEMLSSYKMNKEERENLEDQRLLLEGDEIVRADKILNEYLMNVSHLETSIRDLKTKIINKDITKEIVEASEERLNNAKNSIEETKIALAVTRKDIENVEGNIEKTKEIRAELKQAQKELDTVLDLQTLIANGALLEYVAEEYMYLITEFANKYVYSISRGKYFLKYNGDFLVIDNFNGGIRRGVKTLSGGERFLISLSLALGISQSIATNNNQNFNFFFIDEGFGSLSESYIDKVLQSFDALIRLDFTVGFITHVEKMQNYITNRIVVTKESNEQGSIIHTEG